MLRVTRLLFLVAPLAVTACGGSSRGDDDTERGNAGKSAGGAGRAAGGRAGADAAAGQGAAPGGGGMDAGRGGVDAGGRGGPGGRGGVDSGAAGMLSGRGGASTGRGQGGGAGLNAGGKGGTSTDVEGMLDALATTVTAFCNAAQDCCAEHQQPTMLESCEAMYGEHQTTIPAIRNGAITIDAAALARCQAAYGEGPDRCNLNAIVAACEGVFVGHRAVDEPCLGGYDCDRTDGAMTCAIADSAGEQPVGVCKRVPRAKLDEPCSGFTCRSGEDCSSTTYGSGEALPMCFEDDSLYCAIVSDDEYVCRPTIALGQPCEGTFDGCGSKAHCDTTCQALSDRGEPCGNGCIHQYQCSDEGTCVDPIWSTESACMGYAPGP